MAPVMGGHALGRRVQHADLLTLEGVLEGVGHQHGHFLLGAELDAFLGDKGLQVADLLRIPLIRERLHVGRGVLGALQLAVLLARYGPALGRDGACGEQRARNESQQSPDHGTPPFVCPIHTLSAPK